MGCVISGGVYFDQSSKGGVGHRHHSYRAEVVVDFLRVRRRFKTRQEAQDWIAAMEAGEGLGLPPDIVRAAEPCSPRQLATVRQKPAKCSDVRWRIELARRAHKRANHGRKPLLPDPDLLP